MVSAQESVDVLVIGAGQAGLATGYHLRRSGLNFLIIDASERIGDSWRERWDSLKLLLPARCSSLPGLRFPASPNSFPPRDDVAEYLDTYARTFELPVRSGIRARRLERQNGHFVVDCGITSYRAAKVVVATGPWTTPSIPAAASELDPGITQLHAGEYRRPAEIPDGPVLVVGGGNSGVEIAEELALAGHQTWLAGRLTSQFPVPVKTFGGRLFWFYLTKVTNRRHPLGRRLFNRMRGHGALLLRIGRKEVLAAGVTLVPRFDHVSEGMPVLTDGQVLRPRTIVWCTGFGRDFSWIDQTAQNAPGLHFVGMPFAPHLGTGLIGGVGDVARKTVAEIAHALERAGKVA